MMCEERPSQDRSLVYSCSGCSSAAQLANEVALRLDRQGDAEMSCIAGVGGDVVPLVRLAKSGRPIVAIDGCALACVQHCLARHDVVPTKHYVLRELGIPKNPHQNPDPNDVTQAYERIRREIGKKLDQGL